jgi:hypothetical protein
MTVVLMALCSPHPTPWWVWIFLGPVCLLAIFAVLGSMLSWIQDLRRPK